MFILLFPQVCCAVIQLDCHIDVLLFVMWSRKKLVIAKTRIFFRLKFPVMLITAELLQVLAFQQKLTTL